MKIFALPSRALLRWPLRLVLGSVGGCGRGNGASQRVCLGLAERGPELAVGWPCPQEPPETGERSPPRGMCARPEQNATQTILPLVSEGYACSVSHLMGLSFPRSLSSLRLPSPNRGSGAISLSLMRGKLRWGAIISEHLLKYDSSWCLSRVGAGREVGRI